MNLNPVVVRIYGKQRDDFTEVDNFTELISVNLLGKCGLGPEIYGIFREGRIEEFIPVRINSGTELTKI